MNVLIGLNPLTIKQAVGIESKINIARKAGYSSIGLRGNEIEAYLNDGHSIADLRNLVSESGLTVSDVGSIAGWQFTGHPPLVCRLKPTGEQDPAELYARLDRFFGYAKEIGCDLIPAISAIDETGDFDDGVEDFRRLCKRAGLFNLRIALEFVGFGKQINSLSIANRLIAEADQPNGGLLFDTFHFHRSRGKIEELLTTPAETIFLVHLNDVMDKPIETIGDPDRLYPGLGVVDLPAILRGLESIGYSGPYSLEIFNEDYWAGDPEEVAVNALAHTKRVFEAL